MRNFDALIPKQVALIKEGIAKKVDCSCVVYISEATVSLNEAALLTLLRQARAEHEQAGLTGFLLYHEGWFMQVLEGPPAQVREFFGRIAADPRHCKVEVLADGPHPCRDFAGWLMCFRHAGTCPLPDVCTLPELQALVRDTSIEPLLSEFLTRCHVPLM